MSMSAGCLVGIAFMAMIARKRMGFFVTDIVEGERVPLPSLFSLPSNLYTLRAFG